MKREIVVVALMILSIGLVACGTTDKSANQSNSSNSVSITAGSSTAEELNYKNIKPEDAKKRLDSEERIILLDVRTPEEYAEKHIPDSLLIPVEVIENEAPSKLTDKNATIFVYCRSGRRSVTASEALVKMGYTKVFNLGGINAWTYATESGN